MNPENPPVPPPPPPQSQPPQPPPPPPTNTSLSPEERARMATELCNVENAMRLILTLFGILFAAPVADAMHTGPFGWIVLSGLLIYLIWFYHRGRVRLRHLKSPDWELLDDYKAMRAKRRSGSSLLGCLGSLFKAGLKTALVLLVLAVITGIFLASSCPDEHRVRSEVFGQNGQSLEQLVNVSGALGGPKIAYHDFVFFSVLELEDPKPDGTKALLALGACNRVWVTEEVQKLQEIFRPFSQ